jgi:hypothetical protein
LIHSSSNPLATTPRNSAFSRPEAEVICASPARFQSRRIEETAVEIPGDQDGPADARALLRYWRSALRADPRGAITQMPERHGVDWHLISGAGPVAPDGQNSMSISVPLYGLAPDFRQALLRRQDNELSFAIGWPISVGSRSGVPAIWPVGLFAAEWRRTETHLEISIESEDTLINPDWLRHAARTMGWRQGDLRGVFADGEGAGLTATDFLPRLREAAAGHVRGGITGERLLGQIDPSPLGIYDIAGIFLSNDSSFTAGAVRDLDAIAAWPVERLARTALAPVLGITLDQEPASAKSVNVGPLNEEQIGAVGNACSAPLSVVTGPPGTGKSQVIVSIAASVLIGRGSVIVASKNHQALDAVENRLGQLAPDVPFMVRTLDPAKEIDRGFSEVLADLVVQPSAFPPVADAALLAELGRLSRARAEAIQAEAERREIEFALADLLERIAARAAIGETLPTTDTESTKPPADG